MLPMMRTTLRSCYCQSSRIQLFQSSQKYYPTTYNHHGLNTARFLFSNVTKELFRPIIRRRCTGQPVNPNPSSPAGTEPAKPQGLFQKFKTMMKDYWYVMIPVHVVTSLGWFGAFYKVSASGVDLGYYLRKVGVSESIVKHITDSGMGNIAVAWALYKVATPARYAVTLGGTTVSINVLRNMGYIKPANVLMAKGRNKIQSLKDKKFPTKD